MKQHPFWKSRLEVQSSATAGANRAQCGVRVMHSNACRGAKPVGVTRLEVHTSATAGEKE